MAENSATERLFRDLNGETFESFSNFSQVVLERFNGHLAEFPAHYTYRDAISWARRNGWLQPEGDGLRVQVDEVAAV